MGYLNIKSAIELEAIQRGTMAVITTLFIGDMANTMMEARNRLDKTQAYVSLDPSIQCSEDTQSIL